MLAPQVHYRKIGKNFFPKNLGWLNSHKRDGITRLEIKFLNTGGAYLTVRSQDWEYKTEFASAWVCTEWVYRNLWKRGWVTSDVMPADTWYMFNMWRLRPEDWIGMWEAGVHNF